MRKAFGPSAVDGSGNKVFTVREGSRSLAADVVPCTTYRLYWPSGYYQGIELILDRPDGKRHYNYPDQHYDNGVSKNLATSKRYKRAVRILKNIENRLAENSELKELPSYLMECLAYNVPDPIYNNAKTWRELVSRVSAVIWQYAHEPEPATGRWLEVNGYKYLFHADQQWTRDDASQFGILAFGMVTD